MADSATRPAASVDLDARYRPGLLTLVWTALVIGVVVLGRLGRHERYFQAEDGLGYRLGILGASMMLLLLVYSARKRIRLLSNWGPLSAWFRFHMFLGIAGPLAILFHSNFSLGSLNANIALVSMLLVAGSGLVGRFIYGQVHHGLYGRRASLQELRRGLVETQDASRPLLAAFPEVLEPLDAFEARHTGPPRSGISALCRLVQLGGRARRLRRTCLSLLSPVLHDERRAAQRYIARMERVAEFSCYERLFRLWHALHVPLFALLVVTAIVHVLAVHMY